jgi:hypothetical protein
MRTKTLLKPDEGIRRVIVGFCDGHALIVQVFRTLNIVYPADPCTRSSRTSWCFASFCRSDRAPDHSFTRFPLFFTVCLRFSSNHVTGLPPVVYLNPLPPKLLPSSYCSHQVSLANAQYCTSQCNNTNATNVLGSHCRNHL